MDKYVLLEGLILKQIAPVKRQWGLLPEHNKYEYRLSEPAVMLAFSNYLLGIGATDVTICPDGMHGKQFDIRKWLVSAGYNHVTAEGKTSYGGLYQNGGKQLRVWLRSGQGDVRASIDGITLVAECKGGVINSKHSGVRSALRSNLREAIGALLERPAGERNIAVVPDTAETRVFSERASKRTLAAGIEIALVSAKGEVRFVKSK